MSETVQTESAADETRETILEIRDVRVTYEMSRGRARVLDDVRLQIERGETLGIVGESGCGKSMFASTMMDAVVDPGVVTGEMIYHPEDGAPVDLFDVGERKLNRIRWEEIALVDQGSLNAYNPTLTIRSHFTETFDAHDVDREAGLERAHDMLDLLNLDPDRILDAYQHELSGGEKQRVLIALGLVFDPELLILDEPTGALDVLMQRNILSLLFDIKEEFDMTVVVISHDVPILSGFADRLAVMYSFDIIELGRARDVLLNPEHPYTRLLLKSTLDLSSPIDSITTIEGSPPDPINVPQGCPFNPRCPAADDRCTIEEPELRAEAEDDHEVACFYPDVGAERIPLSLSREDGDGS